MNKKIPPPGDKEVTVFTKYNKICEINVQKVGNDSNE